MQHQQLNEEDKFEHYRKQLHALRTHKIKQQRRLQLLQEEGRKLRTLPSVIERLIHFFSTWIGSTSTASTTTARLDK